MSGSPADRGEDPEDGPGPVDRRAWVFWVLLLVAAGPLLVGAETVRAVFETTALSSTGAPGDLVLADRWTSVMAGTRLGWSATLTAFGALVLAGVLVSGRPALPVPDHAGRRAVASLAAVCGAASAASVATSVWTSLQGPTALQRQDASMGSPPPAPAWLWGVDGGLHVLSIAVAALAVVLCVLGRRGVASPP